MTLTSDFVILGRADQLIPKGSSLSGASRRRELKGVLANEGRGVLEGWVSVTGSPN